MKSRRQVDQLVVFIKILKAGDEQCLKMLKKVLNEISALIPIYKGESNPLNLSSYSIWLLEHAFKLYERVLEKRLRKIVNIDNAVWFYAWKQTVDAVLLSRRLAEKIRSKARSFFVFFSPGKVFDQLLCKGNFYVLRK